MDTIRDIFGKSLVETGEKYKNIVVISCDLKGATRTKQFFDKFPDRSFEVGIAEANGIGIATGLALSGYRPFISSFAPFITGKNIEIRTSVAYNNAPVVIVGTHGGFIGADGTTQAGLQDITTMRAMPNFIILQPASNIETKSMIEYLANSQEPAYIRISRNAVPEIYGSNYEFVLGKGYIIKKGIDLTVFASGYILHNVLSAVEMIKEDINVMVVNLPSIKPIDKKLIEKCCDWTKPIMTVEDHTIEGGFGSAVAEVVAEYGNNNIMFIHGIKDVFTESGTPNEVEHKHELDAEGIAKKIIKFMKRI